MSLPGGSKCLLVSIQSDNGHEFISKNLDYWAYEHCVTMDVSCPGKPTPNLLFESFNGGLDGGISEH